MAVQESRQTLTEAQSGLWFAQRMDPGNPLFNTGQAVEIRGALDVDRFRTAVDQCMAEADALALRFVEEGDTVYQQVDEDLRPWLQIIDLSASASPYEHAREAMRADSNTALDPCIGPLAVERLYLLGAQHFLWYRRVHHLAIDGYGMTLLNNRITELYHCAIEDREAGPALAPLSGVFIEDAQYRRAAQGEAEQGAPVKRVADAAFWREQLQDAPEITGMVPGRATSAHAFDRTSGPVDPALVGQLLAFADQLNVPWPDVLTALAAAYCHRFSGGDEVVIGVPWMGRLGSVSARVPAMVMNVLPLRLAIDGNSEVREFIVQVSRALLRTRRHGRYRSEQLRRDLGLLGGHRRLHGALVNILPFELPVKLTGVEATLEILSTGPVDDLTFTFRGDPRIGLLLETDSNPALYGKVDNVEHSQRLLAFVQRALTSERLNDVQTAMDAEAHHYLHTVNQTAHEVEDVSLTELIERGLRLGSGEALIADDLRLTHDELEQRTRALAAQLRAAGIGSEDLVAIAIPRSGALVVALLSVLRAGAAYLPLDTDHPPARIQRILASARPKLVLADQDCSALGAGVPVLEINDWHTESSAPLARDAIAPNQLAYVIYTSGSTGEPKGAMIEHRSIVNRLEWMRQHYHFTADDRILQKTPATFDVSVWEFFLPFICGASLVVAPPGSHRDPLAIAGLIRDHVVTTAHFVPSMLAAFLGEPTVRGLQLRQVFCSGEELGADLRDRFHTLVTAELHNLYGPTEAAVDVSWWPAGPDDGSRPVPIGFPVWNTRLYILDAQMRPLPPGVAGDLYLAGVQVGRGYLGRAELTAERFVADPFVPGGRMYLTGDIARWRRDGAVEYLGRSDGQVKIRGLRIELGEIEAALMSAPGVQQCGVIVREDQGVKRLVAYVVAAGSTTDVLRAHVLTRVPDYMLPAAFVMLDALPTTSNGKLDRRALPAPDFIDSGASEPATATERWLAKLYAEVLNLPSPASASADFFSLGGDSLLAVGLMNRIRQAGRRDPGLGALFEQPTVSALAAVIDADEAVTDNGLNPVIRLAQGDDSLPPLFVVHPAGGISWCYRALANSLSPARTVYGLQAPALDSALAVPSDINALARDYVSRIREIHPDGPYHLAGWSVGGIVVQAMAVVLRQQEQRVGVAAMFDSYPCECWRAEPEPTATEALRSLLAIAGFNPDDYPQLQCRESIVGFLRQGGSPLGNLPEPVLDGVIRVVLDINRLVRTHYHEFYDGTLLHILAGLDHADTELSPALWKPYAAQVEVEEVPFLHPQLTGPEASAQIARILDARMRREETPV